MSTIADSLRWHARRHPDFAATWFEGRTRTFRELDELSTRLAAGLAGQLGLKPGDRIGILDRNSDDFVALVYALNKAGAVSVPINFRLTSPEIAVIADDARLTAVVAGEDVQSSADRLVCPVLEWSDVRQLEASDPRLDREETVAWQLYTSGTTGAPKGVMLGSRNVFGCLPAFLMDVPEVRQGGRHLVAMPLYHIAGMGWSTVGHAAGSCAVITNDASPGALADLIFHERVETAFLVPTVLHSLVDISEREPDKFSTLTSIAYGASPITQILVHRLLRSLRCRLVQMYGLTETAGMIALLPHEDHGGERLRSCGRAIFGTQIQVVGPDNSDLAAGEPGEIMCRGSGIMLGYWNRAAETAAVLREGWFRTGDVGMLDASGYLYIIDRLKDIIISGSENVYPTEIESVLAGHPSVTDVAVIGVPDEHWGETVKALIVARSGEVCSEIELISWCRERLAGFKVPRSVSFVEHIPRTASGKILKRELRAQYAVGSPRR